MFLTNAEAETGVKVPVHFTPAPEVADADADADAEADADADAVGEVTNVVAEGFVVAAELELGRAEETAELVAAVPGTH
jgi:hypothetical protein